MCVTDMPGKSLDAKRALITGAAAGIGRAVAVHLASLGAQVALADIDSEALAVVNREIGNAQSIALSLQGSVAEPTDMDRVFSQLDSAWGGVDILVNNAGITANKPTLDLTLAEWNRALSINLTGTFYCA